MCCEDKRELKDLRYTQPEKRMREERMIFREGRDRRKRNSRGFSLRAKKPAQQWQVGEKQ